MDENFCANGGNKRQQREENEHNHHEESNETQPKGAKKRKAQHKKLPKDNRVGNFRSYYTYRLGQKRQGVEDDDPRLSVLEKEWFCDLRGLDIGCNSGDLTLAIAKRFEPSYILGIDIDAELVSRARALLKQTIQREQIEKAFHELPAVQEGNKNAKKVVNNGDSNTKHEGCTKEGATAGDEETGVDAFKKDMPLSFRLWKPPHQSQATVPRGVGKTTIGTHFPWTVVFKREDIVKDAHAGKEYNFITCFSVTKWIHLFHGDDGIKDVFRRIYDLLAPGGRLILEPQPWKSYHKRKFTSEITAANYHKIQLRPKDFPTFLVEVVGFKKCTFLQVCQTSAKGFRRPIYMVEK